MKHIGFLTFGHWTASPQSQTRTAADALLQTIELAVAAEELGAEAAFEQPRDVHVSAERRARQGWLVARLQIVAHPA